MTREEADAVIAFVESALLAAQVGSGARAYQRLTRAADRLRALADAAEARKERP